MTCKSADKTNEKIEELQEQVRQLQESHDRLKAHYQEFVKATVLYLKENEEE